MKIAVVIGAERGSGKTLIANRIKQELQNWLQESSLLGDLLRAQEHIALQVDSHNLSDFEQDVRELDWHYIKGLERKSKRPRKTAKADE